jgi:hypothetical protein
MHPVFESNSNVNSNFFQARAEQNQNSLTLLQSTLHQNLLIDCVFGRTLLNRVSYGITSYLEQIRRDQLRSISNAFVILMSSINFIFALLKIGNNNNNNYSY